MSKKKIKSKDLIKTFYKLSNKEMSVIKRLQSVNCNIVASSPEELVEAVFDSYRDNPEFLKQSLERIKQKLDKGNEMLNAAAEVVKAQCIGDDLLLKSDETTGELNK